MFKLKEKKMIFVFTGPDGSGRKTVGEMVGNTLGIPKVLSYTTRKRRPSEVDGQDYHFISREAFEASLANGEFMESREIDGMLYGVKERDIADYFEKNDFVYVVLNAKGARTLKERYGDQVARIFIHTDLDTILARQRKQKADEETIERHIAHFQEDMSYMPECKHAVENSDLAHTVFAVSNLLELYMDRQLVDKD